MPLSPTRANTDPAADIVDGLSVSGNTSLLGRKWGTNCYPNPLAKSSRAKIFQMIRFMQEGVMALCGS